MNAPAAIGHNQPPPPTPFEDALAALEDARAEALAGLNGEPVVTAQVAQYVVGIMDMADAAWTKLEAARKIEAKPHDDGKAAVQAKFKPLQEQAVKIKDAAKAAYAPWHSAEQARIERLAAAAREAAAQAARDAAEARRAADASNLAAVEQAEQVTRAAAQAAADAKRAEQQTAGAKSAMGGRRKYVVTRRVATGFTDRKAALQWCMANRVGELGAALLQIVKAHKGGDVPGVSYEDVSDVR